LPHPPPLSLPHPPRLRLTSSDPQLERNPSRYMKGENFYLEVGS
jgi:hypothetical protein